MDELKLNKIVDEVIDNKTSHSLKGGVARGGCQCGCCYEVGEDPHIMIMELQI